MQSSQGCVQEGSEYAVRGFYLLSNVCFTGVNAVMEQILCAAVTTAKVTVVEQLPVGPKYTCKQ